VIRYRLSAVVTVLEKLDRRLAFTDVRFEVQNYINLLVTPDGDRWIYEECDRPKADRHPDWLWRIAEHGVKAQPFKQAYERVYKDGRFWDQEVKLANNYVIFSSCSYSTYIVPSPPEVAVAMGGEHEYWIDSALKRLTVDYASELHKKRRNFLRSKGLGYVHPKLRFRLGADAADSWRQELISTLRERFNHQPLSQ
jgi:hypothetical protein